MLKKMYKNNGIIIIGNKTNINHQMKLYYFITNNYQKLYTFSEYIMEYHKLYKGFTY